MEYLNEEEEEQAMKKLFNGMNLADIARKENFPRNLPIYYMNNNRELIQEWANGDKFVIKKLDIDNIDVDTIVDE